MAKWKQKSGQDPEDYIMRSEGFILFNEESWKGSGKQHSEVYLFIRI